VVDENATIGNNCQIINKSGVKEADRSESERSALRCRRMPSSLRMRQLGGNTECCSGL
jgi:hypothetical protein